MAERLSDARLREIRAAITPYPTPDKWLIYAEDVKSLLAEVERVRSPEVRELVADLRDVAYVLEAFNLREDSVPVRQAADLLDAGE